MSYLCPLAGVPMASAQCLKFTLFNAFGGLKLLNCDLTLELFESKVNVCIYIFEKFEQIHIHFE